MVPQTTPCECQLGVVVVVVAVAAVLLSCLPVGLLLRCPTPPCRFGRCLLCRCGRARRCLLVGCCCCMCRISAATLEFVCTVCRHSLGTWVVQCGWLRQCGCRVGRILQHPWVIGLCCLALVGWCVRCSACLAATVYSACVAAMVWCWCGRGWRSVGHGGGGGGGHLGCMRQVHGSRDNACGWWGAWSV